MKGQKNPDQGGPYDGHGEEDGEADKEAGIKNPADMENCKEVSDVKKCWGMPATFLLRIRQPCVAI